jgi:cytochrome c oxidase assembly protein subunit 15
VRRILLANLAAQVGIVLTGGLVRLTGSGLGCPTWPECVPGSYTPVVTQAEGIHKDIEFGNRLLTFVVGLTALATLVAIVVHARRVRAPRRLVALGAAPLLGVVAQAVLGGVTVLTGLSPITVAAHFLVSMVLVAGSTVLLLAVVSPSAPSPLRREVHWLGWAIAGVAAVVLVLGTVVTGSGPHSGDADTPARFAVDPQAASWLHADAVWLFVGLVVALVVGLRVAGASDLARRRTHWLLGVTLAQGAVGYVQYATDLPVALVAAHMLGASLLVVAVVAALVPLTGTPAGRRLGAGPTT